MTGAIESIVKVINPFKLESICKYTAVHPNNDFFEILKRLMMTIIRTEQSNEKL
jgi:hypothetical protein